MITGVLELTSDAWTEIASGSSRVQFSSIGADGTIVCFSESDTVPSVNSSCHFFASWPNGFDFDNSGYPNGQRIWARSKARTDKIVVTRETNFYFAFIPANSDGLITSDGDNFRILGNG